MDRITQIKPLNKPVMQETKEYLDSLLKPIGSLGRLEEYAIRLSGIRGFMGRPFRKSGVLVFAADNGVHAQGITPVPKIVTTTQTINIAKGLAGVSVLARQFGSEVFVYNAGVERALNSNLITDICARRGTDDITMGPAMTRDECISAIRAGIDAAISHSDCEVLGIGEMGICNTTTSAAVASALTGVPPAKMTGRGAGINDEMMAKKIKTIERALQVNSPDPNDCVDVISKVGGLDIAAMTGSFLGAAWARIPVVIDGYISAVAALCAYKMNPLAREYMFASHKSLEAGYTAVMEALELAPAFDLQMRLGEGSGCPILFYVLNAALKITDELATFEEGNVDPSDYVDIREK